MLPRIADLSTIALSTFKDERGVLGVAELGSVVKYPVRRMFWIYDVPAGGSRGGHAHKLCHQFMFCLTGHVSVEVYDGYSTQTFFLPPASGIHIPPAIYAAEWFDEPCSVLAVLCDQPFDADDYIDDHSALVAFRSAVGQPR